MADENTGNCALEQTGLVALTPQDFEGMLERASHRGAKRALDSIGLSDDDAPDDLKSLRDFLSFWKGIKSSAMRTAGNFIGRIIVITLVVGIAMMVGASDLVQKYLGLRP